MLDWEKKKNKCWIWKAVDLATGKLIDWELRSRSTVTFQKLFKRLENRVNPALYCSDYWASYPELIESERLILEKAGTHRVEGHNSNTRHWFACMLRKSKVIAKTLAALELILKLQAFENQLWQIQPS